MTSGPSGRLDAGAVRRVLIGSTLGAAALWLTFRHTDLRTVGQAIGRVHVWPLWMALLLVAATVTAAARRWELLVYRGAPSRHLPQFLAAVTVGQMLNVLLPVRLGEVVRAYWIGRSQRQPLGRVLATIAVERLTDVCVLGVSVSVVLTQVPLPAWAINSGRIALAVSVGAAVVAIALGKWGASASRLVEAPLRILPDRLGLFLRRQGRTALDELRALGDWRASAKVWALSVVVVAFAAATNYVLFWAFDFPLSPMTANFTEPSLRGKRKSCAGSVAKPASRSRTISRRRMVSP